MKLLYNFQTLYIVKKIVTKRFCRVISSADKGIKKPHHITQLYFHIKSLFSKKIPKNNEATEKLYFS